MRIQLQSKLLIPALSLMLLPGLLGATQWNAVVDGGFEEGSPNAYWNEMPTAIIAYDETFAHSGIYLAAMGMYIAPTSSSDYFLSQSLMMGTGTSTLKFWLKWDSSAGNNMDYIRAWIDGSVVFEQYASTGTTPPQAWEQIIVPLGQYPDGQPHELKFEMHLEGTSNTSFGTLFFIDDVEVITEDEFPTADFHWNPPNPNPGASIQFFDDSTGYPDQWAWDFGDGTQSTDQNPTHSYAQAGVYIVNLSIARTSDNAQTGIQKQIQVQEPLFPEFTWTPAEPLPGDQIFFTNESVGGADTFLWDFGDGTTSESENPSHTYSDRGAYQITLDNTRSSDGAHGRVQHWITVAEQLFPEFTWTPENPMSGETITFSDTSSGNPDTWEWDFGDGSTATTPTASHVYEADGNYEVTLNISRTLGNHTMNKSVTHQLVVGGGLQAAFAWGPQPAIAGAPTHFQNLSTGDIVSSQWDFGDGGTANEQSPVHVFFDPGSYEVSLQVRDTSGAQSSITHQIEVVSDDLQADFSWDPEYPRPGEQLQFLDASTGTPLSWHWDFGDGRMSNEQNPVHRYTADGVYPVVLKVIYDQSGETIRLRSYLVTVSALVPHADFFWLPLLPRTGENVEFFDLSTGEVGTWSWDFGDGNTSRQQNPTHAFEAAGEYEVTLQVIDGTSHDFSDTITRRIRVVDPVNIDFSWLPDAPKAQAPVQFSEDVDDNAAFLYWNFGDGESARGSQPTHIFPRAGQFTVQLWAADADGRVYTSVEHQLEIAPPELELELQASNGAPEMGENVDFRITSRNKTEPQIEAVRWNFGGLSCDGSPRSIECIPSESDSCLERSFSYASPGLKGVWVMLRIGGNMIGPVNTAIQVLPQGHCDEAPVADFGWWPAEPMQGQRVRCVDKSSGGPEHWGWNFDDGTTSARRHPVKIFEEAGEHQVSLEVSNDAGTSTVTKTISVRAVTAECGNAICEPGENRWNCAADCGDGEERATGRSGRKNTGFAIPAAAGGIPGNNGTYWITDGTIINPGEEETGVILQFYPDQNPESPLMAGPAILPPKSALHFDNIVTDLFGVHQLGGVWIDSSLPVIVNTRTFNQTADGTLGQAIGGISKEDTLGEGDGSLYLLGLVQNENFRTNILIQEVTGTDSSVIVELRNASGAIVKQATLEIDGGSRWQKGLTALGIEDLEDGYALVSVAAGGRVGILASKVDQRSGDATTIDPIHHEQMELSSSAKSETTREHFLVAVVARDVGANNTLWRSEMSILNPESEAQTIELRYTPSDGGMLVYSFDLEAGEVFATPDVLANYFPEVGNDSGALHVYSDKALAVSSRTYNLLPTDATVGQSIPGLADGDMARPGEVWLLDSLRDDEDYRCNVGFAEYEGNDTQVTVVLFDTSAMAQRYLGYRVYDVPAYSQLQINRVFRDFGIDSEVPQAIGYLSVSTEKGAVYGYASIVDNAIGDGTTILAKRQ